MLTQLCYASVASAPLPPPALQQLLDKARANNERDGITGLLLYGNGHFVQVLEGDDTNVSALYARILKDSRHRQVFELYREPVTTRDFRTWTMAFDHLAEFKPDFLLDRSSARMLVELFLEKERTLTLGS
ncbi:MAG: BLUF domain-containing protein [Myxococcaceae bacterium]|nr:BLUF domain-containing protein [Myxococcaceae bacterium]